MISTDERRVRARCMTAVSEQTARPQHKSLDGPRHAVGVAGLAVAGVNSSAGALITPPCATAQPGVPPRQPLPAGRAAQLPCGTSWPAVPPSQLRPAARGQRARRGCAIAGRAGCACIGPFGMNVDSRGSGGTAAALFRVSAHNHHHCRSHLCAAEHCRGLGAPRNKARGARDELGDDVLAGWRRLSSPARTRASWMHVKGPALEH